MCECVNVCVYACVCLYACVCMCVCVSVCSCVCVCVCVSLCACFRACMRIYVCVCIRECVRVCVYTYGYVWYTHTQCTHTYSQVLIILAGATQLTSLSIQGCAITDKGLSHLVNLPRLESLELGHHDQGNGPSVSDAGIGCLAALQSLRSLQLACDHKLLKGLTLPRITQVTAQHVVKRTFISK